MHHLVARFPGTQFYGTTFRSMHRWQDEEPDKLPIEALPLLLRHRLVFVDTPREPASGYNCAEAQIAAACARALAHGMTNRSLSEAIGIITPFRKQIRTIAELLGDLSQEVTIDTVERFQGSERDHIIVSCAINSRQHLRLIESLTELDGRTIDRKLNVALTRARHQVIIIGNRQLLELSPHYAALIGFIEQHGIITNAAAATQELTPFLTTDEHHAHHRH
jgi:DNA replication ATP-dependent helicase Dna2